MQAEAGIDRGAEEGLGLGGVAAATAVQKPHKEHESVKKVTWCAPPAGIRGNSSPLFPHVVPFFSPGGQLSPTLLATNNEEVCAFNPPTRFDTA